MPGDGPVDQQEDGHRIGGRLDALEIEFPGGDGVDGRQEREIRLGIVDESDHLYVGARSRGQPFSNQHKHARVP